MNYLSYKTQYADVSKLKRDWYVVDAANVPLGRLSSQIATILRGKNKPSYSPHMDCGDFVVILNADKVRLTGLKWKQKEYITYSGYTGGQKRTVAENMRAKFPERIVENAVRGMLPKNRLGRQMFKKLFVYTGAEHPHGAQQPKELKF